MLPPGAAPIRVLHLSDLHMAPWQRDKQDWVRSLAALEPDLIVDTGDNLGHERGIEGIRRAFEPFRGIPGVFVNGSNDYFGPVMKNPLRVLRRTVRPRPASRSGSTSRELHSYFDELGWHDLDNTAAALDLRGTHFEFFGVDDPHKGLRPTRPDHRGDRRPARRRPARRRDVARRGIRRRPAPDGHRRRHARALPARAQLVREPRRATDARGPHARRPGLHARVSARSSPTATSRAQQAKGLSVWRHGLRSAFLNVSAGLGTSIYAPVRFACPPEATLLTLVATE